MEKILFKMLNEILSHAFAMSKGFNFAFETNERMEDKYGHYLGIRFYVDTYNTMKVVFYSSFIVHPIEKEVTSLCDEDILYIATEACNELGKHFCTWLKEIQKDVKS